MSLPDTIATIIRCPITLELAYEPVLSACGHLFDSPALSLVILASNTCPICRQIATPFVRCQPVIDILAAYGITRPVPPPIRLGIGRPTPPIEIPQPVQIIDDDVPELIINAPDEPLDLLDWETPRPSFPRSVQLTPGNYVNPNSSNYSLLLTHVHPDNVCFINRNRLRNMTVNFHRYIFRNRGNVVQAMDAAARHGYYVYDLFNLAPNTFMIYTLPYRANASLHQLESYRSYRDTQQHLN